MMIDVNAYIGHWPFRKLMCNTPEGLDGIAKKASITHMLVSSLPAIFYKDTMQGNLELLEELKSYNGETKLIPYAVINPTYPAWREDMARCVKELGFRGIELCPVYHGYSPAREGAEAFCLAGELGVPVRICAEFENIRQQHRMDVHDAPNQDELAAMLSSADTTLFLTGFCPAYFTPSLTAAVNARDNVFCDICRIDSFMSQTWEKALALIGPQHLCFGSLSPFYYVDTNLVKLLYAPNTQEELDGIRYANVQKYI